MADTRAAAGSAPALVYRRDNGRGEYRADALAVEEPLEIRLRTPPAREARNFAVTMRTPGADVELATGLLFAEGVIGSPDDVLAAGPPEGPRPDAEIARNVLVVDLAPGDGERPVSQRSTVMSSACGVCGRLSIEDVLKRVRARRFDGDDGLRVSASVLIALPEELRRHQAVFASTGGLHAVGLFEADGTAVVVREDVGRHNAADKAVGALLLARRAPPPLMLASGRLAFEIVQKAVLAGIRIVAAVSAPTSLAVELAEEAGVTLVGFLRGERFNAYTHPRRIDTA